MSTGRVFQAFGGATGHKCCSLNIEFVSVGPVPAERSEARPEISATGVTSSEI